MEENIDPKKLARKLYYQANKEKILERSKLYNKNNKEKVSETNKERYNKNKEKIITNQLNYYEKNKDKIKEYKKSYDEKNKKEILEKAKLYYKSNKTKINNNAKIYFAKRKETDALFKITNGIRSLIYASLKNSGFKKLTRTEQILGCTFDEFKQHLESKFEPWMNWNNQGNPKDGILELNKTWDIDHIIPLASATCEADIIKLNHFSNLQPLCSYTNRFIKKDNPIE